MHVEDQRRRARVVDEYQVGVELDMCVAAGLHGRVRFRTRRGCCDFGKEASGWERSLRYRPAGKGFGAAMDVEEGGVRWFVVALTLALFGGVNCNGGHFIQEWTGVYCSA